MKYHINWAQVARKRLDKIHSFERRCATLRDSMHAELVNELTVQLNTHCLPRDIWEDKIDDIACFVANRIRPKIPS